jgi:hypothetical protein
MTVYFITGKLGAGKSLVSVGRMKDKFLKGLPVATNLDIKLHNMLGRHKKNAKLYRLPDKPTYEDLKVIGVGNKSYDEEKNGLLVLDECGTWFNSRSWADKSRQEVINWFLHARKLGWDVIFIVQDMQIVDKQARLALAEHVVVCRRTDRLNIPILGAIFKLITGSKIPLPKLHLGLVFYGTAQHAPKVDTWVTTGNSLYSTYDTKQRFSDSYDNGVYSVLPPWYTHGRHTVPWTMANIMRMSKIYFRRWSRFTTFLFGAICTFLLMLIFNPEGQTVDDNNVILVETKSKEEFEQEFDNWRITSFANYPGQLVSYHFEDSSGETVSSESLRQKGIRIKSRGACEALLVQGRHYASIFCN